MKRRIEKKAKVMALAALLLFTGCGSSSEKAAFEPVNGAGAAYDSNYSYTMADSVAEEFVADYKGESSSGQTGEIKSDTSNRKLIKTVGLDVETTDFNGFVASATAKVNELGGYIENMDTYNGSRYYEEKPRRHSNIKARIPKDKLDGFVTSVSEDGNVTNHTESVEDVTLTYVDIESRKKALKSEEERLNTLMERAENVEELITIEDRLSSIRYQLESIESQLRTYDNQVDYSTVNLHISEVIEYTQMEEEEEGALERMAQGFMDSLSDVGEGLAEFGIWIVVHIPYLAVLAIVVVILVLLIRLFIKWIIRFADKVSAPAPKPPVQPNVPKAPDAHKAAAPAAREQKPAQAKPQETKDE